METVSSTTVSFTNEGANQYGEQQIRTYCTFAKRLPLSSSSLATDGARATENGAIILHHESEETRGMQ